MSINNNILIYLKKYSFEINTINRLITTAFCKSNSLTVNKNVFLKNLIINKDDVLDQIALKDFNNLFLEYNQTFDFECLIQLFEFVISPNDKIVNGAVYTPQYIRRYIVNSCVQNDHELQNSISCDVACGCGGFLYEYAILAHDKTRKSIIDIIEQNLFGIDITEFSIERTKILLSLLAISYGEDEKEITFNLFVGDSLDFDWFKESKIVRVNQGFNYVFSNPPYVGSSNLDNITKELMKNWEVASTGKLDLYIPFFEIGLKWLNENGILGYITVNNFYRSLNGRALRKYFSEKSYNFKLIDFGSEQVFKARLTYTCICQISKTKGNLTYTNSVPQKIDSLVDSDFIDFEYSSLNDFDGWQLERANVQLNLKKIETTGEKLGDLFSIRNGFATLRNRIYLFTPTDEDNEYFYFEKNSKSYKVEKSICRDAIKPNILKDEEDILRFNEKLIFPYTLVEQKNDTLFHQHSNKAIKIIKEYVFKVKFPYAYSYFKSQETELAKRDKGQREYEVWYAFGRNQALNIFGKKLLFPYISDSPYFVYTNKEDLLFYNGYAVVSDSEEDLKFVQKILKTEIFWYYIKHTSKPYSSNYYALAKNYVKNFGIPNFTIAEKKYFMSLKTARAINKFLLKKYNITVLNE